MTNPDPQSATSTFTARVQDFGNPATHQSNSTMSSKTDTSPMLRDPFASQRTGSNTFATPAATTTTTTARDIPEKEESPFREGSADGSPIFNSSSPTRSSMDRRMSKEWDASKVPPSRFQKREGSIYATAGSRDSHLFRRERDASYHAKLKEKGWS